jgi:hypothetical protein
MQAADEAFARLTCPTQTWKEQQAKLAAFSMKEIQSYRCLRKLEQA